LSAEFRSFCQNEICCFLPKEQKKRAAGFLWELVPELKPEIRWQETVVYQEQL